MACQDMIVVSNKIDSCKELLNDISQEIWKHPELKYEETHAHEVLTNALEKEGFVVQRHYFLPTAFRAEYSSKGGDCGPTVAVICEYDALPEIGHACGHNLIAEAGFGAGIAIKAAMEARSSIPGKVVVLGTPAEEGGGGKVQLVKKGALKDIDISMMVHPAPINHLFPPFIAIERAAVTYRGKAAHASGYPWQGINALDAAVQCYNNLSMFRQQMKPTWRLHGIIKKGGVAANIIPDDTELEIYVRAMTTKEVDILKKAVENSANAAALSTGCQMSITWREGYKSLITNRLMATTYEKYSSKLGVNFADGNPNLVPFTASSDMGDFSFEVPSIHPTYYIGTDAPNHSIAFTEAAGAPEAQFSTLVTAKSMAMTCLEIMQNPALLEKVRENFKEDVQSYLLK